MTTIPDFLPGGYVDDVAVLAAAMGTVAVHISQETIDRAKARTKQFFRDSYGSGVATALNRKLIGGEIMVKRKKRVGGFKVVQTHQGLSREVRRRSRLFFGRQKVTGHVIESKKFKPVKHRYRQELSWADE